MKRRGALVLALCVLFSLAAACGPASEQVVYEVYFLKKNARFTESALGSEQHRIDAEEDPVTALLERLVKGPESEKYVAAIPEGTQVRDQKLENGLLTVDFSSSYGSLSGIELTLADYSVTMTLSQVEGVSAVAITVEGEPVTYRSRETLQEGDVWLSISQEESSTQEVSLFFPKKDLAGLGKETRSVAISEGSMAKSLLDALALGPENDGLLGVISEEHILSVEVQNGVCMLDLSTAFWDLAPKNKEEARLVIKAIADSLRQLHSVTTIYFLSEGSRVDYYGGFDLTEVTKD